MSSEQYSPLDTTLPFYSNRETFKADDIHTGELATIPFLLQLKGIARRVKIVNGPTQELLVYFNNDNTNPAIIKGTITREFNQWIKSVRLVVGLGGQPIIKDIEIEFDIVPVKYLPNKERGF